MKLSVKLSEAIREGAKLRPQAFGAFFKNGGSCAEGAAAEAVGCAYNENARWEPATHLNQHNLYRGVYAALVKAPCPVAGCVRRPNTAHLNDDHRWTREAIADWLEELGL